MMYNKSIWNERQLLERFFGFHVVHFFGVPVLIFFSVY